MKTQRQRHATLRRHNDGAFAAGNQARSAILASLVLVLVAACGRRHFDAIDATTQIPGGDTLVPDGPLGPFGAPTQLSSSSLRAHPSPTRGALQSRSPLSMRRRANAARVLPTTASRSTSPAIVRRGRPISTTCSSPRGQASSSHSATSSFSTLSTIHGSRSTGARWKRQLDGEWTAIERQHVPDVDPAARFVEPRRGIVGDDTGGTMLAGSHVAARVRTALVTRERVHVGQPPVGDRPVGEHGLRVRVERSVAGECHIAGGRCRVAGEIRRREPDTATCRGCAEPLYAPSEHGTTIMTQGRDRCNHRCPRQQSCRWNASCDNNVREAESS